MTPTTLYYIALFKGENFLYLTNGPYFSEEDASDSMRLLDCSKYCYFKILKQDIQLWDAE
jgi:hypothetical protein